MKKEEQLYSKQAIIYYLGHSGWAVKTEKHFLIFDYFEQKKKGENKSLLVGCINPAELSEENVFVFVSHRHEDHYDRVIHEWEAKLDNITYIAGWNCKTNKFIGVPAHNDVVIEDIKISTLKSTDEGVGFLVKVDGMTIFHAGDHANWEDEPEIFYCNEIDYIAQKASNVDIAFLPVSTYNGNRPVCMTEGAVYAINKLKCKAVFPMHGNEKEYLYKEFAKEVETYEFNIICAEMAGDKYFFNNGAVET